MHARWPHMRHFFGPLLLLAVLAPVRHAFAGNFWDKFSTTETFNDTGTMRESASPVWWLSSGGRFHKRNGLGATIQGNLASNDPVRLGYAKVNPVDTDDGYHPQNIFRLVTRGTWKNFRQEVYFRVKKTNLSSSPNRTNANGIFLRDRYGDENNLYYLGVRVDGLGVIKKKRYGKYYTLGKVQLWGAQSQWSKWSRPNLLPANTWIGIRSWISNNADGSVSLRLYVDRKDGRGFRLVVEARESGAYGPVIPGYGYAGIRTDFMDVEFDDYAAVAF